MNCPVCGAKTIVTDSRSGVESVKRRRKCTECDYRFGTIELETEIVKKEQQRNGDKDEWT